MTASLEESLVSGEPEGLHADKASADADSATARNRVKSFFLVVIIVPRFSSKKFALKNTPTIVHARLQKSKR